LRSIKAIIALAVLGIFLVVACFPAAAARYAQPAKRKIVTTPYGSFSDLQAFVIDATSGRVLRQYNRGNKIYVVGKPGTKFAIQLLNQTSKERLAVVSVDGINTVTGEEAHPSQQGYVIPPLGFMAINGWRKSRDETIPFSFQLDYPTSLHAGSGPRTRNAGAIGVAIFDAAKSTEGVVEVDTAPPAALPAGIPQPPTNRPALDASAEVDSKPQDQKQATHGMRLFERATPAPLYYIQIYYDAYENLVAQGIIIETTQPRNYPFPNAFPGSFVVPKPDARR